LFNLRGFPFYGKARSPAPLFVEGRIPPRKQCECDDRRLRIACLVVEPLLKLMRDVHLAPSDFGVCRTHETQLTAAQAIAFIHPDRWTENSTGHGTPGVDVAESRGRIESGTWRFVGELLEPGLLLLGRAKHSRPAITGKFGAVVCKPFSRSPFERRCRGVIRRMQYLHPGAKTHRVERVDCEGSMTALRAAGAASEPRACATGRIGEGRINNLHEFMVSGRELHKDSIVPEEYRTGVRRSLAARRFRTESKSESI